MTTSGAVAPGESRTVDLGGPVHYVDFGGPRRRPDGRARARAGRLAPQLGPARAAADARTPACWRSTCPGFGRSEPGDRRATVHGQRRRPRPVPRRGRRRAGRAGRQLDGRDDLDPRRRPAPGAGAAAWSCSTRRCPGRGGARTRSSPASSRSTPCPGSGSASCWLRRTRQTPLRRVRELLRLCGVDPDTLPSEVIDRSVTLIEEREDVDGHGQGLPRRRPVAAAGAGRPAALPRGDGASRGAGAAACTATGTGWSRSRRPRRRPAAPGLALRRARRASGTCRSCRCPTGSPPRCSAGCRRPPARARPVAAAQRVAQRLEPGVARLPAQLLLGPGGVHDHRVGGRLDPLGHRRQERQPGRRRGPLPASAPAGSGTGRTPNSRATSAAVSTPSPAML